MDARRACAEYRTRYAYPLLLTPSLPPNRLSVCAYRNSEFISDMRLEFRDSRGDLVRVERAIAGRQALGTLAPNTLCIFHPAPYVSALGILPVNVP